MYTGTLIRDLMVLVERAQLRAEQRRMAYEQELQAIFSMQIPIVENDRAFLGAA